jgi:hypothetical protein
MVGFLFGELIEERNEVEEPGNINRCSPKSGTTPVLYSLKEFGWTSDPKT